MSIEIIKNIIKKATHTSSFFRLFTLTGLSFLLS